MPEELIEAELFGADGHETIFTRADGGTVILEEINYLPIRLQSQLNSYLEEVGNLRMNDENVGVPDVRIIATSSERLDAWVDEGKFREILL